MKEILKQVTPLIREWGFKGSGQNYYVFNDQSAAIINFQKSSGGDRFYINLGVQPLFVPTEGDEKVEPKKIKEYSCIFRKRLDPPEGMLGWLYDMNAVLIEELKEKLKNAYESYITPLMQIPGPVTDLTPDEYMKITGDSIFGRRHARGCLHFARIALARGEVKKAREFLECGLTLCSPAASSLIASLDKLMKETE